MTSEDRAEMERLVRLIQDEQDPTTFTKLITQLNALLDKKDRRLNRGARNKTQGSSD
jgi:hypothetical protein